MTVADLIARLQECEPSALVVLAADAEGNGFSPAADDVAYRYRFAPNDLMHCTRTQRESVAAVGAVVLWPQ